MQFVVGLIRMHHSNGRFIFAASASSVRSTFFIAQFNMCSIGLTFASRTMTSLFNIVNYFVLFLFCRVQNKHKTPFILF